MVCRLVKQDEVAAFWHEFQKRKPSPLSAGKISDELENIVAYETDYECLIVLFFQSKTPPVIIIEGV